MKYILSMILLLAAFVCNAAVYMQVDPNGTATYTDVPSVNAQKVDPNGYGSAQASQSSQQTSNASTPAIVANAEAKKPYTTFLISSPVDQQTFQNQRDITVEIKIQPDLQKGDKIQAFLDGKPVGDAVASTHLQLKQLDRGTHQINAVLIGDNQANLKQSNSVTVFIHYASTNSPALKSEANQIPVELKPTILSEITNDILQTIKSLN